MRKNLLLDFCIALGSVSVTTIIALVLTSMNADGPYLVLLLGTLAAAMLGGSRAGWIAIALATLVTWYYFVPPPWSFTLPNLGDVLTLVLFLVVALAPARLYYRQRQIIDELNAANVTLRQQLLRIGRPGLNA
jgi:two-component system sensor histidine kinase KdpD